MLANLTGYIGVSGHENCMANELKDIFEGYGLEVTIDDFYNVIAKKKGNGKSDKKVMVTAHYDEIGLMVKSIDEKGFITFTDIGGIDAKILVSQEVIVHGKRDIYGVIGQKPPHLLTKEEYEKVQTIQELSIDVGYTKKELQDVVSVGDIITFRSNPIVLNKDLMSNKTMDNRSGVLAILQGAKLVSCIDNDMDIYFVATTQEEFNLEGSIVVANSINPDFSIVVDACHGAMSDAKKEDTFEMAGGVAIAVGPNLHRNFTKKVMEVAKANGIPYQIDVEPGNTGTECWAIQVSNCGIPTVLLSIPVKYMHTTIEMVNQKDIKNTAKLLGYIVSLGKDELEGLLCY